MQQWIDHVQMKVQNRSNFFGHQYLYDDQDNITSEEKIALIFSLNASLTETVTAIRAHHGKAVLAHIYGRKNGIITQLGFIPRELDIDGIEVSDEKDLKRFISEYPDLQRLPCFINSDAHTLSAIHEATYDLSLSAQKRFWDS